jgi:hypothetical protein
LTHNQRRTNTTGARKIREDGDVSVLFLGHSGLSNLKHPKNGLSPMFNLEALY